MFVQEKISTFAGEYTLLYIMRRHLLLWIFLAAAIVVMAVPARKVKRIFTLADGSQVTATLTGDEYAHWWQTDDGRLLSVSDEGKAEYMNEGKARALKEVAKTKRQSRNAVRQNRMQARKKNAGNAIVGEKKGLIILVNFPNLHFHEQYDRRTFDDMFNKVGYSENGHIGSLHDYFLDQSYGLFDLTFDVVGPIEVSNPYSYYGKNDSNGDDQNVGQMVIEACQMADEYVDFADYDWDGDGEVDQVLLIYAGYGENAGASALTIWPHEYTLADCAAYGDGNGPQSLDGVTVNTYAVTCELAGKSGSTLNGIGTACHEFSHCLGYPDFYDTDYSGGFGMKAWDVMDSGLYCGPQYNGEVPTGYTSYERWVAGWLEPKELTLGMEVEALQPLCDDPDAYIVYNDGNHDEYYLLENRYPKRWFTYLEEYREIADGLLVLHVDYDEQVWADNTPNDKRGHQRMTIIPANNRLSAVSQSHYAGHVYPYQTNDSLTNMSTPKATVFNENTDGQKLMNKGIWHIRKHSGGSISFKCSNSDPDEGNTDNGITTVSKELFDDNIWNTAGQKTNASSRGVKIINGKKVL